MKIVVIKMTKQEHGFCGGNYAGTAKLYSSMDGGELVEDDCYFQTTSAAVIPFRDGAYIVSIRFGRLGKTVSRIQKDSQTVPLHQVVVTYSQNNIIVYDEDS
ncbi:unnamed protein product [Mortierella alpina]